MIFTKKAPLMWEVLHLIELEFRNAPEMLPGFYRVLTRQDLREKRAPAFNPLRPEGLREFQDFQTWWGRPWRGSLENPDQGLPDQFKITEIN